MEVAAAAKVAIEAAQGEAAASESLQCTTTTELKKAESTLKKVNKAAPGYPDGLSLRKNSDPVEVNESKSTSLGKRI